MQLGLQRATATSTDCKFWVRSEMGMCWAESRRCKLGRSCANLQLSRLLLMPHARRCAAVDAVQAPTTQYCFTFGVESEIAIAHAALAETLGCGCAHTLLTSLS